MPQVPHFGSANFGHASMLGTGPLRSTRFYILRCSISSGVKRSALVFNRLKSGSKSHYSGNSTKGTVRVLGHPYHHLIFNPVLEVLGSNMAWESLGHCSLVLGSYLRHPWPS